MSNVITARVSDEVLAMIDRIATSKDRSRAWIVATLVESAARSQTEFDAFIQEGIDAIERGDTLTQDEMEQWLEEKIARRSRPIAAE